MNNSRDVKLDMMDFGEMEEFIKQQICKLLKLPNEYISKESDFGTFGFDSIAYTDLAEILNKKYSLHLTPATFFEYHTIESLLEYIRKEYPNVQLNSINVETIEEGQITQKVQRYDIKKKTIAKKHEREFVENPSDIAIIGMAGIMPGCDSLDEFWDSILGGKDLVSEIPLERWDWHEYYGDSRLESNKTHAKWGGFIKDIDCFDAEFFGISPKEAQVMDPQQRLFLQIVWHAVEDAGYNADELSGKKVAVFVGTSTSDYQELLREEKIDVEAFSALGVTHSVVANRVSYFMNWSGESSPVDTACSSALVALHRSVKSLQNNECEIAVAGGINCILSPSIYLSFDKAGMLSSDGKSHVFDKSANGYVRGEGGGAVILKPLQKAIDDHDNIYAVIRGSAVNHCGKTNSLSAPNPNAQAEVICAAMRQAGVSVDTIDYIETHGTGTPIGDPIEVNGLKKAFGDLNGRMVPSSCGIGSVKSNVGHLEAASGIASLFKVLLCMRNNTLAPTIHFKELNPYIDFSGSPFYVVNCAKKWRDKENNKPKRAGISSFGFSGVNAHVVLEEYNPIKEAISGSSIYILVLSARSDKALIEYADVFRKFLDRPENSRLSLDSIAYTSQIGRKAFEYRLAVIYRSVEDLKSSLNDFVNGKNNGKVYSSDISRKNDLLGTLFNNQQGKDFLRKIVESNDIETIGKLWVSGYDIDWSFFYEEMHPYRISLPGYPFEKKRYWMKKGNKAKIEKQSSTRYISQIGKQPEEFEVSVVLRENDWRFRDHLVLNEGVFPGAIALQLVMETISEKYPEDQFRVDEINWLSAITTANELLIVMRFQKKDNEISFEISDGDDKSNRILFAKGRLSIHRTNLVSEKICDIELFKKNSQAIIQGNDHYAITKQFGVEFGPHFRSVSNVYVQEHEVLTELNQETLSQYAEGSKKYVAIDGAFQSVTGLYRNPVDSPILPFYVGNISFSFDCDARIRFAYIKRIKGDEYQCFLLDEDGISVASLERVILKTALRQTSQAEDCLFIPKWTKKEYSETTDSLGERAIVYLFDSVIATKIANEMNLPDNRVLGIDDPDLIDKLVGINTLFILTESKESNNESLRFDLEETAVMKLYYFLKKLTRSASNDRNMSIYVVSENYMHIADEMRNYKSGGVQGLLRSLAREYSNFKFACLDFETQDLTENTSNVVKVLKRVPFQSNYAALCYRNQQFYEKNLYPVRLPDSKTVFRKNGVYLLVGGSGGIGSELAKYLLKKYNARIAIVGRKPELPKELFSEYEQYGGDVFYVQADIGIEEQMKMAIERVERHFGELNGVVHLAVVLDDKAFHNMEPEDMKKVLWPKANGTVALHNALTGKKLDFILFFNSVQPMIGMIGQSNYAAACDFKETYANYISKQESWKVCSIYWGYWGEIGAVSGKDYRNRMKKVGIYSIGVDEGLRYVEQTLANNINNLYVMKSNAENKEKMQAHTTPAYELTGFVSDKVEVFFENRQTLEATIGDRTGYDLISDYAIVRLMDELHKHGIFVNQEQSYSDTELTENIHLLPKYERLFDEILSILERNQMIEKSSDRYTASIKGLQIHENLMKELKEQVDKYPEISAYIALIDACMDDYCDILGGVKSATEVMFPSGSVSLVGNIYNGNQISDFYNKNLAQWIEKYVKERLKKNPNQKISILEIGAGTGGTSAYIFESIKKFEESISYVYSDVSESFVLYGKKTYSDRYPNVEYKVVDIEKEVTEDFGRYDLIIGTNVLHASSSIVNSLQNLKTMMKQNAALVFCEMVTKQDYMTLTFGLLDGWWVFKDGEIRIPGTPLISKDGWRKILLNEGFNQFDSFNPREASGLPQDIIVAYSDGIMRRHSTLPATFPEKNIHVKNAEEGQPVDEDDIKKMVRELIYRCLEEEMDVESESIVETKAFRDYGIDSITGVKLVDTLNQKLGIDMKTIVLFDNSNIKELVDYISVEYQSEIMKSMSLNYVEQTNRNQMNEKTEKYGDDSKDADQAILSMLNQLQNGEMSVDLVSDMLGEY